MENNKNQAESISLQSDQEQIPLKNYTQIPYCNPEGKFELTAKEFAILQNHFHLFSEPVELMKDLLDRNLNNGNILTKYVDEYGEEVDKQEVIDYIESMKKNIGNK